MPSVPPPRRKYGLRVRRRRRGAAVHVEQEHLAPVHRQRHPDPQPAQVPAPPAPPPAITPPAITPPAITPPLLPCPPLPPLSTHPRGTGTGRSRPGGAAGPGLCRCVPFRVTTNVHSEARPGRARERLPGDSALPPLDALTREPCARVHLRHTMAAAYAHVRLSNPVPRLLSSFYTTCTLVQLLHHVYTCTAAASLVHLYSCYDSWTSPYTARARTCQAPRNRQAALVSVCALLAALVT